MNLSEWFMSVWHRITGFRGSGQPREAEPDESSDVGPEQTEAGQSRDDGPETVELVGSPDDSLESSEQDEPHDASPEPPEPDEPSDDANPERAEQDEPHDASPEPPEPDELSDDASPEPPEPDEPSDDANPEPAEQDEPHDASPEPPEPGEPSDDTNPEPTEQDEPHDASPEPPEPDEPSDDASAEPPEPDEPSDDANPEPAEQDEPHDASPEPTEQDEPHDDDSLEPNEPAGPTQNRKGAPRRHGGRRGSRSRPSESSGDGPRTFAPKSELICRKPIGSWQWEVILSVPQERKVERVRQGDRELSAKNHEYSPWSFSGSIVIEYEDGSGDEIQLFDDAPLVFKLPNQWHGDGRRVRGVTRGHFVVIAPRQWTRNGHVPVGPEGCVDDDFTAHFFYKGQDDEPNDVGGFEEHALFLARSGYALEGKRIHDDSEEGDLFVGAAPVLKRMDGIVWVRVGEEAPNGWEGQNFRPSEQSLRDVLGGRQGRFYVRVYDKSVELVDSGEFRYCTDLQEIRVNNESYSRDMILALSLEGHSPTSLKLVGVDGSAVSADLMTADDHVTVATGGVVTVAPHPEADETTWLLGPSGPDVVIRLPRVWWRLVRPRDDTDRWRDRPVPMSRDEFREQSQAETGITLRLPSHVRQVRAGFDFGKDGVQLFPAERVPGNSRRVILPLAAFVDYEEIEGPSTRNVSLKIRCDGDDIELIHVIPDAPPPRPESLRDQQRRRDRRRDGIQRDGRGRPRRRGPKSQRSPARPPIPEKTPVLELPQVAKKPLVVKNPLRRYHLNIARGGAALFTLVVRTKCPEHQLMENERSTSHTRVGKHIKEVRECCASTADYLASGRLLKDAVFRVVLSEYDRPLTAQQISDELNKRWPTSKLDLSPRVIERILDSDPNYAPVVQKSHSRRTRRAHDYHSRRGSS